MLIDSILLFVLTFLAGLLAYRLQRNINGYFRYMLVFAGSYLLGITVVHILPELFEESDSLTFTGIFILVGFFLQKVLEYFTAGVEHGHMHKTAGEHHHHNPTIMLLAGLCLHSLLEGSLLGHPTHHHHVGENNHAILLGILLHKIPAAFALMSVLSCQYKKQSFPLLALLLFALATPVGVLLSEQAMLHRWLSTNFTQALFAIVSGSFLHIATTIFFENSPDEHRFGARRMLISLLGAGIAVLVEVVM